MKDSPPEQAKIRFQAVSPHRIKMLSHRNESAQNQSSEGVITEQVEKNKT